LLFQKQGQKESTKRSQAKKWKDEKVERKKRLKKNSN
jgi:hypothetical protein